MVIRLARVLSGAGPPGKPARPDGSSGQAESQVIGAAFRTSAAIAVLANGALTHALDFDDTLEEGIIHAGSCVGMTALAVGEACRVSGRSVLEAAIAGFEVIYKIGVAAPGRFHARGYHPTSVCAPFGAAAVAGRLYGLSAEQMVHAFGIAGSQSSGIIEYLADGSWTKQFHPGWGAHAGVIAALLASEGFRGPRTVLEGKHGFFAAFSGPEAPILERLSEVGTQWELPKVMFKSYPCGSIAHPYLDCALRIRKQHQPAGMDIERIVCRTHEGPVPRLWEPLEQKQRPVTPYAAKFSLPYGIAVALIRGRAGLEEFADPCIRDADILAVARKVQYEIDPHLDYPRHFSGHVKLIMKDGRIFEENQPHPRGGLETPIPLEEIQDKFRANASLAVPQWKAEQLIERMAVLETLPDISAITCLWTPG
jgi:2-methylcitrate dehydratase PrpD